jgi:putative transposase
MARPLRPNDDGLVYHALSRGNNRDTVFFEDDDFRAFLDALARAQLRYPFRLYGYCLMTNHFHLLMRPEPGVAIGRAMQSLLVSHTWRYHRRRKTLGHVWQGRFKSPPVQDDTHLWTVLRYIEANPARAGMVADLADYPWSSYPAHALGHPDPLLSELPEWDDLGITPAGRSRAWRAKVRAALPDADLGAIRTSLKTGRAFGDEAWCGRQATRHGLSPFPRPRGRPRKVVPSIGQGSGSGRIG